MAAKDARTHRGAVSTVGRELGVLRGATGYDSDAGLQLAADTTATMQQDATTYGGLGRVEAEEAYLRISHYGVGNAQAEG